MKIQQLSALQILDSRGNPTLEVEAMLSDGTRAVSQVPSGASTGRHEAVELRDGADGRYAGKSVLQAVQKVEQEIASAVVGLDAENQTELDQRLLELDGTPNKSRLGANAILGVSTAVGRAAAQAQGIELWRYLAQDRPAAIPVPMINILSGGLHAGGQIEFQDFLAVPHGFGSFGEALEAVVAIHREAERLIRAKGQVLTGVADEGGLGPRLESNEKCLDLMGDAIAGAGFEPGGQISIAIDVAASHFEEDGIYRLKSENRELTAAGMSELLGSWIERYPIISIEDGLAEDDWAGWVGLTSQIGDRCTLVGDDLLVTNPARLERAIKEKAANAVLVKMNQIGTLTETFTVVDRAREAGFKTVISARSGETEDSFLADLATASGAGQIKVGSITRSERLAKYNRLLRIERDSMNSGAGPLSFAHSRSMLLA